MALINIIIFGVSVLSFIVTAILAALYFRNNFDETQEKMQTITDALKGVDEMKRKVSKIETMTLTPNSNDSISNSLERFLADAYNKNIAPWVETVANPGFSDITVIKQKIETFSRLAAELRQKESCCIKEKLLSQGIPAEFQDSLDSIYQFIVALEKDFSLDPASSQYFFPGQTPSQKDWKNVLAQVRNKIDDIISKAEQVPGLNNEKISLNEQLKERDITIKALQSDKDLAQQEINRLNAAIKSQKEESDRQQKTLRDELGAQIDKEKQTSADKLAAEQKLSADRIAALKSSFAEFAPDERLALFNISLDNLDKAGKRSMAVYSYLSLLKELRGSSFVKRFASFDRDLYSAFQGEELLQVRKKIEEDLNPQILSEGYKIAWATPGARIDPDIHYDETNLGQVIAKVKSAVVYRKDGNNWKCDSTGTVETR